MRKECTVILLIMAFATAVFGAENSNNSKQTIEEVSGFLGGFLNRNKSAAANTNAPPTNSLSLTSIISQALNLTNTAAATGTNSLATTNLTSAQISSGLKEALSQGVDYAVAMLGKTNGFLTNLDVRILMPDQLKLVEQGLQRMHQGALVDDFVATMNHAAEKAVPAAAGVIGDQLKQISLADATALLASKSPTAVTDYFRQTTSGALTDKLLPIVQDATSQAGVTAAYKKLLDRGSFASFFAKSSLNVDNYVTGKTLDGLFKMMGDQEKRLREDPAARTTDTLKQIFGAIVK